MPKQPATCSTAIEQAIDIAVIGQREQGDGLCGLMQPIKLVFAEQSADVADPPYFHGEEISRFQHAQLTGTLAHELRTPLGSIRASAYMMQRKAIAAGLDLSRPYQRLEDNLRRCNEVIVTLLEKSWSNRLQTLELNFDEWLSKLIREFASQAPNSIDIECDFAFGDELVWFDPVRLESALRNILTNAVNALTENSEAIENGGPRLSIRSWRSPRGVEVSLSNNGPCIPDDEIESIRQPWVTTEYFGAGMGLSYVKCVLEQHLGGLEVTNLDPHGVEFTAWIGFDCSSQSAE